MTKKSLQDINPLEYDLSTNVSVSPKLGKNGSRYTLSDSQMRNGWDVGRTIDYVGFNEPNGAEVRLPNGTMPRYDGAYFDAVLPTVEVVAKRKRKK